MLVLREVRPSFKAADDFGGFCKPGTTECRSLMLHLVDPSSPDTIVELVNPCYRSDREREEQRASPFFQTDEELEALYGPMFRQPTYPQNMPSLTYCGVNVIRHARPAPKFLWTSPNTTLACMLLEEPQGQVCWECVDHLDQIRKREGYIPVIEWLRREQANIIRCQCTMEALMRRGCPGISPGCYEEKNGKARF